MEYSFLDGEKISHSFYLDVLSKKDIFPEDFRKDSEYTIWYEERTEIIVRVESSGS